MPIHMDDKRLVKQLLANDERAFERFFDENFSRLYRFALARLANDPEATKEVVQLVLTKATRNLKSYRGEAALFTWMCAICRNEISDWMVKQGRYREHIVLAEDYPEIQAAVDSFQVPQADNPERQYQRLEMVRMIQVALDRLPPKYGDVLEWMYIDGHSVKEIAARLSMGQEATQSLLARAKKAFGDVYGSLTSPMTTASNSTELSQT